MSLENVDLVSKLIPLDQVLSFHLIIPFLIHRCTTTLTAARGRRAAGRPLGTPRGRISSRRRKHKKRRVSLALRRAMPARKLETSGQSWVRGLSSHSIILDPPAIDTSLIILCLSRSDDRHDRMLMYFYDLRTLYIFLRGVNIVDL